MAKCKGSFVHHQLDPILPIITFLKPIPKEQILSGKKIGTQFGALNSEAKNEEDEECYGALLNPYLDTLAD